MDGAGARWRTPVDAAAADCAGGRAHDRAREALAPWRKPMAVHDPGKIVLDLAVTLAIGGDCLADIAQLRAARRCSGVASDPTVSRLIDALAADARPRWRRSTPPGRQPGPGPGRWPATHAPDHGADAPAAGHRRGRHPGHRALGEGGRGADVQARVRVPPAVGVRRPRPGRHRGAAGFLLRPGNAGSNTVADHIAVSRAALAQLPGGHTRGKKVLVRIDGAGGTHELLAWLTRRRLSYSVGLHPARRPASIQAKLADDPAEGVGAGLRRRRPAPPRRLGRRGHRPVRPLGPGRPGCG